MLRPSPIPMFWTAVEL